ncbi:hypothetical protein EWB00_010156, partial [Schistosoma japonicum]
SVDQLDMTIEIVKFRKMLNNISEGIISMMVIIRNSLTNLKNAGKNQAKIQILVQNIENSLNEFEL